MTTRDQARRSLRRSEIDRPFEVLPGEGGPSLPRRLVEAREAKGVDIYRAERDTKIRAKYLQALERGDYGELPADVYTKGFLRNYASYLGLDSDEVLSQWRRERGDVGPSRPVAIVPKAVVTPREGITLSRGMVGFVALLAVIGIVVLFIASRLVPYLQPLEVVVTSPAAGRTQVSETAREYEFTGTSTPGVTIQITVNGQAATPVIVDSKGQWRFKATLQRGLNQFEFVAANTETRHSSKAVVRQIEVPIPRPTAAVAPDLTIDAPADGATLQNGAVSVRGRTNATSVTVSARYLGVPVPVPTPGASASGSPAPSSTPVATPTPKASPKPSGSAAPSPSPSPSGPPAPAASTVQPGTDGTFSTQLQLSSGRWEITVEADRGEGLKTTVTRTVTVAYQGLQVQVSIKGSPAWIHVVVDGKTSSELPDKVYRTGDTFTITAKQSVEIRTGRPDSTHVTVNGVSYGALSSSANPATFRIEPNQQPKRV